jgi:hypothetical protein
MSLIYRALIVPAEHVELARQLCAGLAGPAGAGMFTTGLAATPEGPATHYISAGHIAATFAGALSNPAILLKACAAATPPIKVAPKAAAALLAAAQVSTGAIESKSPDGDPINTTEDALAFIQRVGLTIVQPKDLL